MKFIRWILQKATAAAKTSFMDTIPSLEDESVTQMDVKANQASENTDFSSTSDNATTAENISDKMDIPNVLLPLPMESNAEIEQEKNYPSDMQEVDNSLLDAIEIKDAFIFCPMSEPIVLNETLGQGIFASEREMTEMEENKNSISNKFITIEFNEVDSNRSKRQAFEEYLQDVRDNAKEYNSALHVQGVFSFEDSVPVESWLLNSVENLKGHTIELPTNWVDISQLIHKVDWSLLYSLSMERIEAERIYTPIAAFKFWEQQDFKELLNEVMDKSAFYKFCPEEEKTQGISYLLWKCSK